MEDYEYKVIKSHATQSQNSSKSTGNISKFTSKSTSETDQIKVSGGGHGGGPTPSTRALSQAACRPEEPRPTGYQERAPAGETVHETYETYGDSRREIKRLPLYDFRYSFPTFLGEDSRLLEFYYSW